MGFPMARNLRAKMPSYSRLVICEVVEAQIKNFLIETKGAGEVHVARTPREVAEQAVGQNVEYNVLLLRLRPGNHHHNASEGPTCQDSFRRSRHRSFERQPLSLNTVHGMLYNRNGN